VCRPIDACSAPSLGAVESKNRGCRSSLKISNCDCVDLFAVDGRGDSGTSRYCADVDGSFSYESFRIEAQDHHTLVDAKIMIAKLNDHVDIDR
jgi:hypothetical protein